MGNFIGRQQELEKLLKQIDAHSSAVLIYGKRKVGKTTLILEAFKQSKKPIHIYYECTKDTEAVNVNLLLNECKRAHAIPEPFGLENKTFIELFRYLDSLNIPIVLSIDEYPYLHELNDSRKIDSAFQVIIDRYTTNIVLIISGSSMAVMHGLLEESNPLYGRFKLSMRLEAFDYLDAARFYPSKSPYEKVGFYAVFGGSPYILSAIDPNKTLEENIINSLLETQGAIYQYASMLMINETKNRIQSERVLALLGNGKKKYKELETVIDPKKTGNLARILKPLLEMGLIKNIGPINYPNDSRKEFYEIDDNLLRFYYSFIYPNLSPIAYYGPKLSFEEFVEPALSQFVSRRFEEISRQFLWRYVRKKEIKGIRNIGSYYYDDPIRKTNGEFDVAILKKESVEIIEAKYLKGKVNQAMVHRELAQINKIKEFPVTAVGFISVHGFEDNVEGLTYMFTGEDLYDFS